MIDRRHFIARGLSFLSALPVVGSYVPSFAAQPSREPEWWLAFEKCFNSFGWKPNGSEANRSITFNCQKPKDHTPAPGNFIQTICANTFSAQLPFQKMQTVVTFDDDGEVARFLYTEERGWKHVSSKPCKVEYREVTT